LLRVVEVLVVPRASLYSYVNHLIAGSIAIVLNCGDNFFVVPNENCASDLADNLVKRPPTSHHHRISASSRLNPVRLVNVVSGQS
jgi:hypothetical protein